MSSAIPEKAPIQDAKRWTMLLSEIVQGRLTVAQASRQLDMPRLEIESWLGQQHGNDTRPEADNKHAEMQADHTSESLREAYREAMRELRARLKLDSLAYRNFK